MALRELDGGGAQARERVSSLSAASEATLADAAYDRIRAMILRQHLRPGEQTSVVKLAERVDLGRAPVKAAVDRLADEGLVHVSGRRGTFIAQLDFTRARELFEIRMLYEASAAPLIVERSTDEDLERIQGSLARLQQINAMGDHGMDSLVEFIDTDAELHMGIIAAAKNSYLADHYSSLNLQLLISTYLVRQHGSQAAQRHREHVAIVDAVLRRDADLLRDVMLRHSRAVEGEVLKSIEEGALSWRS